MRRVLGSIGVLALLGAAAPAQALTLGAGQGIEVPFSLTAPATGADTLTFNLVGVVALGVSTMTLELYDGTTLLAAVSSVPVSGIAGFAEPGSLWETNHAAADLASVRDGTIDGRIRVLPEFPGAGALTADVSAFTSLLVGTATDVARLEPIAGVVALGDPFVVPEPALGVLLASALLRLSRRRR
jgi:hypothetical protein